ncbi:TPA: SpaH/EbpB family LPXTG-anchored major pilin, partial [Clostridioides difficile]|nr:SpaH/EbpB family LPXTG-anchored major pilin [Clostridioides difficile]
GQYSITAGNPDGVVISGLSAGLYYVEIATDGEVTYQPIVVSVEPKAVEGTTDWTIGDTPIAVKSTTSTITKTVIDQEGNEVEMPSGEVGTTFTFKATFSIGQDMSSFILTDDPTGITVDTDTIKLFKSNGTQVAPVDGLAISDVATVVQNEGEDGFTMSFLPEWLKNDANVGDYYITYEGSINEDAAVSATYNEIKSNINTDGDKVDIKVAELQIRKYENTNKEDGYQQGDKLLQGAVFELYKTYTDADTNTFIPGETGPIEVVTNDQGIAQIPSNVVLEVGGSYVLVEKKAPSGYKPDQTPIQVTLNADGTLTTVDVENIPLGEDEGIDLPETGGMGTVALTAAGVVLVAGAAAFIIRSRKQN